MNRACESYHILAPISDIIPDPDRAGCYLVPSSSIPGRSYHVTADSCECTAYQYRRTCHHVREVRQYETLAAKKAARKAAIRPGTRHQVMVLESTPMPPLGTGAHRLWCALMEQAQIKDRRAALRLVEQARVAQETEGTEAAAA